MVDADDALLVPQYYAGLIPSSQIPFVNSNVDVNHMVDSDDAMLTLQYDASIITQFPVN